MPIFMDRHDLRGSTAEQVAEAHRRDLEVQEKYGVKYTAYWYDEERGVGFCLVHAPDPATAERVHREAHGAIAHAIIPVDLERNGKSQKISVHGRVMVNTPDLAFARRSMGWASRT
jgi:hypothetical protein